MLNQIPNLEVDKVCEKTLNKCLQESEMPGTYYTLDEIAKKMKSSPPKLEEIIENLQETKAKSWELICLMWKKFQVPIF